MESRAQGTDRHRRQVLLGLALGAFLASLDQTIAATALPAIVADLGGLERLPWMFGAYILAATMVLPLAGSLSDRIGRRPVFLGAMGLFLAGSVASGLAPSMEWLAAMRFVQGLGAGALLPVASATAGDLYAPREAGAVLGALAAVLGASAIAGPLLGGALAEHAGWRWVFFVNLPVGAVALAVAARRMPGRRPGPAPPLDVAGGLLLGAALAALTALLLFGGLEFAWLGPEAALLAAACGAALAAFARVERRAAAPVLPPALARGSVLPVGGAAMVVLSAAMFGTVAFVPLVLQAVLGASATSSGILLIPMMLAFTLASAAVGPLAARGSVRVGIVAGPLVAGAGLALFAAVGPGSAPLLGTGALVVIGLGLGLVAAAYMVALQADVERRHLGAASSAFTVARNVGGILGVALFAAMLDARMAAELPARLSPAVVASFPAGFAGVAAGEALLVPAVAAALPAPVADGLRAALAASASATFLAAAAACAAASVLGALVRIPAAAGAARRAPAAAPPPPASPATAFDGAVPRVVASSWVVAAPAAPPRLVGVVHRPAVAQPGTPVTTLVRVAPGDGRAGRVRVELRVAGELVAAREQVVPPGGAEVPLAWAAPAAWSDVVTAVARAR